MKETVEDPVCHMRVLETLFPVEYAGAHYAFCSEQCKERFLANPRLYIGYYGRKAVGQEARQVIKRRCLLMSKQLDGAHAEQIKQALYEMMGIHEVCIEGNKIRVQYDLIQVTAKQITDKLTLVVASLGGGWLARMKLAFINILEEIEISSLEVDKRKSCH